MPGRPKLADDSDLLNIGTMGFRGEALPSIGSVARLTLTSQTEADDSAWELRVDGGTKHDLRPAPRFGLHGTRVDVRDLFFATPARLKFLKSERSESMAISDVIKRLAMANPHVQSACRLYAYKWCADNVTYDRHAVIRGRSPDTSL